MDHEKVHLGGISNGSKESGEQLATLPAYLIETPRIISQTVDQDDWSELVKIRGVALRSPVVVCVR